MTAPDLPDVNVWIALANIYHPHHPSAKQYWQNPAHNFAFCRVSMMGFLRIATQKTIMGEAVHTPLEAWGIYNAHLATGRSVFASEPTGLDDALQRITNAPSFHPRDWIDAYLASFALQAGCRLVSFDKGFAQYQAPHGLDFLLLS